MKTVNEKRKELFSALDNVTSALYTLDPTGGGLVQALQEAKSFTVATPGTALAYPQRSRMTQRASTHMSLEHTSAWNTDHVINTGMALPRLIYQM